MKKIIILLGTMAIVCCGCWSVQGFKYNNSERVFDSWRYTTQNVLNETVNLAFISNAWINGNDSTRRAIEDEFFPYNTRIQPEGGDEYGIYEGTSLTLLINTGGKAIDDTDATWLITRYTTYPNYVRTAPVFYTSGKHTRIDIHYTGNNAWNVKLDSVTCDGSTSDWTISVPCDETPVSLFKTQFTLGGSGVYIYDGTSFDGNYTNMPVTMRYTFTEPMRQKVDTKSHFEYGTVDIVVSKADCNDITVRAQFFSDNKYTITYNYDGVTSVTNRDGDLISTTSGRE